MKKNSHAILAVLFASLLSMDQALAKIPNFLADPGLDLPKDSPLVFKESPPPPAPTQVNPRPQVQSNPNEQQRQPRPYTPVTQSNVMRGQPESNEQPLRTPATPVGAQSNTVPINSTQIARYKPINLVSTQNMIPSLNRILAEIKSRVTMPIIFPAKIPAQNGVGEYYINSSVSPNQQQFTIFIDSSPKCDGSRYCNIGTVSAYNNGYPFIYYSMDNVELTVPVVLSRGIKGYFTPSHQMADYWPMQLEWRDKNVLYSISWQSNASSDEKQTLINIVNSAINTGYR